MIRYYYRTVGIEESGGKAFELDYFALIISPKLIQKFADLPTIPEKIDRVALSQTFEGSILDDLVKELRIWTWVNTP